MNEAPNYIFYLQLEKNLPDHFIRLAEHLSDHNISLVPVSIGELNNLCIKGQRVHMITVIKDLQTYLEFKKIREKYFDFGILNKKYCYYDVTSFENLSTCHQLNHGKSYFHFRLPIEIEDLAREISLKYLGEKKKVELWPGGKKTRLPFDLNRLG